MLLEFGSVIVDLKTSNGFPENPLWTYFGNTRCYILETLAQMGFDQDEPIDWKNVLTVFREKFSYDSLAKVLWEDIVLVVDTDEASAPLTWGLERNQISGSTEIIPQPTPSTSQSPHLP